MSIIVDYIGPSHPNYNHAVSKPFTQAIVKEGDEVIAHFYGHKAKHHAQRFACSIPAPSYDVYTEAASKFFGVPPEKVTEEQCKEAKSAALRFMYTPKDFTTRKQKSDAIKDMMKNKTCIPPQALRRD